MCTEDQHKEVLTALSLIEQNSQRRSDEYQTVPISDSLSFVIDYKDRHYLFAWCTSAVTLDAGSRGTFNLPAESWTQIAFVPGTQIKTSGFGNTSTQITLLSTDYPINSYTHGLGASTNNIGKVSVQDSSGNAISFLNPLEVYTQLAGASGAAMTLTNPLNVLAAFASNNASVPTGAGNTIIKASPGPITTLVVTTAGTGTGNVLIYDNSSTNSGTVLFAFPATISVAQTYQIYGWAKAGITVQNVLNGPVFTVFYS